MVFTVTLSAAPSQDVKVNFKTNDGSGTATAGSDYTPTSGDVNFSAAAGERVKVISVPVLAEDVTKPDSVESVDETFTVTLSGAVNADISTGTATGVNVLEDSGATAVPFDNVTAGVKTP